jgi:hypothetical protein
MSTEPPLKKRKAQPPAVSPPTLKLDEQVLDPIPELSSAPYPLALITPLPSFRAPPDALGRVKCPNRSNAHGLIYSIAARRLF